MIRIFSNLKKLKSQQERLCELRGDIVKDGEVYLKSLSSRSKEYDHEIIKHSNLISVGLKQLETKIRREG